VTPGLVEGARNALAGTDVEIMQRLKYSINSLDKNVSGLLSAIHTLDQKLLWYTIAILIFTAVLVGLTIGEALRKP
jgi:hypothetical protein